MKPFATGPKYDVQRAHAGRRFESSDPIGAEYLDKTSRCSARPGAKEALRTANRTLKKAERMRLKRELEKELKP